MLSVCLLQIRHSNQMCAPCHAAPKITQPYRVSFCAAAPAGTFKRLKFRNHDVGLGGDVNTVKELTKILVPANEAWWCVVTACCV